MKQLLVIIAVVFLGLAAGACDNSAPNSAALHEGHGEEVTADPTFDIKLTVDGNEMSFSTRQFAVFQSKPAKPGETEASQGFELRGEGFVLVGRMPADLKVAPQTKYDQLTGKPLAITAHGGDPTAPSMSKIRTADDKTYVSPTGTLTVEKVFHKKGQYAGVSGTFTCDLQQIKLGDPDDPNNPGDQPIGDPVKATGTFTAKAVAYPYEQL